jgi:hypothetical protein
MISRFESKVVIGTGAEAGIGAATMCRFHAVQAGVKPLTPPPCHPPPNEQLAGRVGATERIP